MSLKCGSPSLPRNKTIKHFYDKVLALQRLWFWTQTCGCCCYWCFFVVAAILVDVFIVVDVMDVVVVDDDAVVVVVVVVASHRIWILLLVIHPFSRLSNYPKKPIDHRDVRARPMHQNSISIFKFCSSPQPSTAASDVVLDIQEPIPQKSLACKDANVMIWGGAGGVVKQRGSICAYGPSCPGIESWFRTFL